MRVEDPFGFVFEYFHHIDTAEKLHQRYDLRREMQDNQVRDNVSGLYHRAHFEDQLRREADLSSREQREFAIVSVSVDGMDAIREAHGFESCERVVEAQERGDCVHPFLDVAADHDPAIAGDVA